MAVISRFFYYLYAVTYICLIILPIELVKQICFAVRSLYTSIITRPSATARFLELIDKNNPASRYKIGKRLEPVVCTVCLLNLEKGEKIRKLKCNHTFHKACVDAWLKQDSAVTCPLCRSTVLPEEIMVELRKRRIENQVYEYDAIEVSLIDEWS